MSAITESNIIKGPILTGDSGIILRARGGFEIFSIGTTDPALLSETQLENATILTAIAVCLNNPQLRETLISLADGQSLTIMKKH